MSVFDIDLSTSRPQKPLHGSRTYTKSRGYQTDLNPMPHSLSSHKNYKTRFLLHHVTHWSAAHAQTARLWVTKDTLRNRTFKVAISINLASRAKPSKKKLCSQSLKHPKILRRPDTASVAQKRSGTKPSSAPGITPVAFNSSRSFPIPLR